MRNVLIGLCLIGCGTGTMPVVPNDGYGYTDEYGVCLLDEEVCRVNSDCCSGICTQKESAWYARCLPSDDPYEITYMGFGWLGRHCEYDAPCGPRTNTDPAINPVRE